MAVGQPWILFTFFFLLPFIVDRCFVLYCLPGIEYSCRLKSFKRFGQSFCSEGRLTILLVITLTMTFTFSSCCLTKVVHYVDFSNSWWTCCPGGTNAKGPMHRSLSRDAATEEQSQNRKGKQTKQVIIGNIFRTEREKKNESTYFRTTAFPFSFLNYALYGEPSVAWRQSLSVSKKVLFELAPPCNHGFHVKNNITVGCRVCTAWVTLA